MTNEYRNGTMSTDYGRARDAAGLINYLCRCEYSQTSVKVLLLVFTFSCCEINQYFIACCLCSHALNDAA